MDEICFCKTPSAPCCEVSVYVYMYVCVWERERSHTHKKSRECVPRSFLTFIFECNMYLWVLLLWRLWDRKSRKVHKELLSSNSKLARLLLKINLSYSFLRLHINSFGMVRPIHLISVYQNLYWMSERKNDVGWLD